MMGAVRIATQAPCVAPLVDRHQVMAIKTSKTKWRDVVLVCKKCQKKLDGGFGPHGDKSLKKALKTYLKPGDGKGRKDRFAILSTR